MSFPIRKFPYLHKIDNLLIDFKKKTIYYEQDQRKFNVLQTRAGKVKRYVLDDETLKKFNEIMDKNQSQAEDVNEKLEYLQAQMRSFNEIVTSKRSREEELNEKFDILQAQMNAFNIEIRNVLLQFIAEHKV